MFQQPQRYQDLTYTQKADLFNRLFCLPAFTLISWGRRDVGYRCLTGNGPALMFLLSLGIALFTPPQYKPLWLAGYALFSALAGAVQRFKRWRELKRGVVQHSYYIGTSPLNRRWLPGFIRRERRVERFLDPLFFGTIGVLLWYVSEALSCWFLFSVLSLSALESTTRADEFKRRMDLADGVITSEFQGEVMSSFTELPDTSASRSRPDAGLPTGIGADIEARIQNRRKQRNRKA